MGASLEPIEKVQARSAPVRQARQHRRSTAAGAAAHFRGSILIRVAARCSQDNAASGIEK
jgi:hypothetical protein